MDVKRISSKIKLGTGDLIFVIVNYCFIFLAFTLVFFPLIYIVSASFSSPHAVVSGRVWLFPVEPTLLAYRNVFKNPQIVTGYANSIFYTVAGTGISLILTTLAAYPLSRKEFAGRNFFMALFIFTMLFSGGMIPTYLLVKNIGIIDSRWAMLLPSAMGIWNVIITRTYFQTAIPDSLYEAAEIDGCSDFRFLAVIILPLAGPILAVMTLYYAVGIWNSYFDALLYLKRQQLFPLQIILRNILIINQLDASMIQDVDELLRKQGLADILKYAIIVVASAPLLMIYPFVQKYFVQGIMIGSLKG